MNTTLFAYKAVTMFQSLVKTGCITLCFALCVLLWAMPTCMAAGPDHLSLQSFSVLKEHGQLIIRAPIDIEPREAMRHMLRDGAQTLLTCTVSLERERSLLPRTIVAASTAAMILSYDPLSRQYTLSTALPEDIERLENASTAQAQENPSLAQEQETGREQGQQSQGQMEKTVVPAAQLYGHRDFTVLMDTTLGRLRMPLCSLDLLEAEENYFATVRVELRHSKVPPWLSQTLFFWSWDVVPSIEFSQPVQGE